MTTFKYKLAGVAAICTLAATSLGGAAHANTEFEQNIDYLVSSLGENPDNQNVRTEILHELEKYATDQGISIEKAAQQAASDSKLSNSGDTSSHEVSSHNTASSSGGNQRKVALGTARYIGDVFYSSNSTAGVQHGHNGIYVTSTSYVEAAGIGKVVVKLNALAANAPAPAYKYYVGWNKQSPNKIKAANFALSKLGKRYNVAFFNNKFINSDTYNCSQLVWAAYKSTDPNVDLDANGGPGVYPADIANSHWTTWYETKS